MHGNYPFAYTVVTQGLGVSLIPFDFTGCVVQEAFRRKRKKAQAVALLHVSETGRYAVFEAELTGRKTTKCRATVYYPLHGKAFDLIRIVFAVQQKGQNEESNPLFRREVAE